MKPIFQVSIKVIFIDNKKQTLILRRSDYDGWEVNCWEFPGGRMAYGETIEEALRREILEETQLSMAEINDYELLFADTKIINQYTQNVYLFFMVPVDSFTPQLSFEHSEYKWIPIECIFDYISFSDNQVNKIKRRML
ncbi:MAG: NUDIX domain-containing protein [Bacillota bacterium]